MVVRSLSSPQNPISYWILPFFLSLVIHGTIFLLLGRSSFSTPRARSIPVTVVTVTSHLSHKSRVFSTSSQREESRQVVDVPPAGVRERPNQGFLGVRDQKVLREEIARDVGAPRNMLSARLSTPPHSQSPLKDERDSLRANHSETKSTKGSIERTELLPDPLAMALARQPPVSRTRPRAYEERGELGGAYDENTGEDQGSSRQPNKVDRLFGPVTLLNTRSHPFSAYLIQRGWRALRLLSLNVELSAWFVEDLRTLHFPVVAYCYVDQDGKVIRKGIEVSSGSAKIDRILLNALEGALRGFPPPTESLRDGITEVVLALEQDHIKIGIR